MRDIMNQYVTYVKNHYVAKEIWVVFDGYPDDRSNSTKSYQRFQRHRVIGLEIKLQPDTPIKSKQKDFLSNEENEKRLIQMLCQELQNQNIKAKIAEEDADLLIVKTGMATAVARPNNNVDVVGEDVDLLVIMNELAWTI
ncbi:hypothetical protein QAD02_000399 [Eretmocerus hayati]|uniref:Uncharacterized protein n=1 Tax=Eretmocerus hayati TaxID=131215 RepID=A0ACC2NDB5_9HYME|nr:hypothetical protein QAD02_000399 [Eretmocerus hayati]